jgi:hypothetical protein
MSSSACLTRSSAGEFSPHSADHPQGRILMHNSLRTSASLSPVIMHRLSTAIPSHGHSLRRRCAHPCPQELWTRVPGSWWTGRQAKRVTSSRRETRRPVWRMDLRWTAMAPLARPVVHATLIAADRANCHADAASGRRTPALSAPGHGRGWTAAWIADWAPAGLPDQLSVRRMKWFLPAYRSAADFSAIPLVAHGGAVYRLFARAPRGG